jgi:hypothetical protein
VSFGHNQPYALGPVSLMTYRAADKQLVIAAKPANG